MPYSPGIRDVIRAQHEILASHRNEIDQRLGLVVEGFKVRHILDYFTTNVDTDMLPLLMIEQTSEAGNWIAMPEIADMRFSTMIWGLVHYDKDEFLDALVGEFAQAVKDAFNRRHRTFKVRHGWDLYFNEEMPISRIQYGAGQFGSAILRGFMAEWNGSVCFQQTDETTGR